jgi:superfamily I DNA/RNA helicase
MDFDRDLNPAQRQAVMTTEGPVLVIAGAGSGKTRTIVYRLAHLVSGGVDPASILLLTFTRKAAQEMLTRAGMLLAMGPDGVSGVSGGTFHAFAFATLRRFRDRAREMCPHFVEVYVKCPLEVCQERDPKGLYARRARGEINDVDGIDIPYEEALSPEVVIDTSTTDVEACAKMVVAKLEELGYI